MELSEVNVRDLIVALNQASLARDFEAMKAGYAPDAVLEIDLGREKKHFSRDEYFNALVKNNKNVTSYTYESEGMKIDIQGKEGLVHQTVVESTQGSGPGLVRSKTEAAYKVRIVGGKPRITRVDAKVIIARASSPLELGSEENGGQVP